MESELKRWYDPEDLGRGKLTEENNASRLEETIKRDKASLAEKELAMKSVVNMIDRFDGVDNQILKMRYIDGMTLKDISLELEYSYSYIMSRHSRIVEVIKMTEDALQKD